MMQKGLNKYIDNWFAETGREPRFTAKSRKPMTLMEWACAVTQGRQHTFNAENVQTIYQVLKKVNPSVKDCLSQTTYKELCIGGYESDRLLYANVTRDVHQNIAQVVAETNAMVHKTEIGTNMLHLVETTFGAPSPIEATASEVTNIMGKRADRLGMDFDREGFQGVSESVLMVILGNMALSAHPYLRFAGAGILFVDFIWDLMQEAGMFAFMKTSGWSRKFAVDGDWDFRNKEPALRNCQFYKPWYSPFFYYGGDKGGQGLFKRSEQSMPGLFHYDDMTLMAYGAGANHFFCTLTDKTQEQFLIEYGNWIVDYKEEVELVQQALIDQQLPDLSELVRKFQKGKASPKDVKEFALDKVLSYIKVVGTVVKDYQPALKYGFYGWAPTPHKD